ncbi:MAG: aldo/keto reductase, partial [Burkholderiales bacterium]
MASLIGTKRPTIPARINERRQGVTAPMQITSGVQRRRWLWLRQAAVLASNAMNYRRLGRSGLKLGELSFGSWVTYANQVDTRAARELMAAAFAAGVNFFDNAEVYANGRSEEIMGAVLKELRWPRTKYAVSTKFYW